MIFASAVILIEYILLLLEDVYMREEKARVIEIEQTEEVLVSAPTSGPLQQFSVHSIN